jgi:23S rRNA (guanine2445-N2)-methyltransferase / 23S rRNA (guanine2069-N7)-methyltransferase
MEFIATCPMGFERLLADEFRSLGLKSLRPLHGQLDFTGSLAEAYKACLWSRLASRIIAVRARIPASNADELYAGVSDIAWEDEISALRTFAVDAHGTNSNLRNTQFVAVKTKDAIVDRLRQRIGRRPTVDSEHPDIVISVRISREKATVGIDLVGEPLFRRNSEGLRSAVVPLRHDYAAALLAAGKWYRRCRHDGATLISMCPGSGSILLEAAEQTSDHAPGLSRKKWSFESWLGHEADSWDSIRAEATRRAEVGSSHLLTTRFFAADPRFESRVALNADKTLPSYTYAQLPDDADSLIKANSERDCLIACDFSWLSEAELAREAQLSSCICKLAEATSDTSELSVLASSDTFDTTVGHCASESITVFVGNSQGAINCYQTKDIAPGTTIVLKNTKQAFVSFSQSEQFARRLEKDYRLRRKWARRQDINCLRIYDADLPDYALSIDLYNPSVLLDERRYGGKGGGPWAVVAEYAAPKEINPLTARQRLIDALILIPAVLDISAQDLHLRMRTKSRGGSQYSHESAHELSAAGKGLGRDNLGLQPGSHLVDEGGLTFEINLSSGLDSGLFLDTRLLREQLREMMKQAPEPKRFLNLFAYTGSASCFAADGGARNTTTVDLSHSYLEWAARNMARNGFVGPEHNYIRADVLTWVDEQRHSSHRWDLIYLDPPTFSNSSKMASSSFDIQRDHVELLIDVSRLLAPQALCIFCCNLRGFKPDLSSLETAGVELEDISSTTIPDDFSRNSRIHHCYILRRT